MKRWIKEAIRFLGFGVILAAIFVAGAGWASDKPAQVVETTKPRFYNKAPKVVYPPVQYVPGKEKNNDFLVRST